MSRRGRKELTLDGLMFGEAKVVVPAHADISPQFAAGGKEYIELLQDALDELWDDLNTGPDLTLILEPEDPELLLEIVPFGQRDDLVWAMHAGHKAHYKQPVPFVRRQPHNLVADSITIKMAGSPDQPTLVRAYPGDYVLPLPWMRSAEYAEGGVARSREFWATHAYVYDKRLMEGFMSTTAPVWYTNFARYEANRVERLRRREAERARRH